MKKILILIGGIFSFIVGMLIFLVGIGAIAGCAGGLIALFLGVMITLLGLGAIIEFVAADAHELIRGYEIIDLVDRNGKWATGN